MAASSVAECDSSVNIVAKIKLSACEEKSFFYLVSHNRSQYWQNLIDNAKTMQQQINKYLTVAVEKGDMMEAEKGGGAAGDKLKDSGDSEDEIDEDEEDYGDVILMRKKVKS